MANLRKENCDLKYFVKKKKIEAISITDLVRYQIRLVKKKKKEKIRKNCFFRNNIMEVKRTRIYIVENYLLLKCF